MKTTFHLQEYYRPLFPICIIDIDVKQISNIITLQQYYNTLLRWKRSSLESKTTFERESLNWGQTFHNTSKSIREKTCERRKRQTPASSVHCTIGPLQNGFKSTRLWQIISPWMLTQKFQNFAHSSLNYPITQLQILKTNIWNVWNKSIKPPGGVFPRND